MREEQKREMERFSIRLFTPQMHPTAGAGQDPGTPLMSLI